MSNTTTNIGSKVDWDKPIQTRDGREVTLVSMKGRGLFPVLYYVGADEELRTCGMDGNFYVKGLEQSHYDIINKPQKIEYWVNVYPTGPSMPYNSRVDADDHASIRRTACIKVSGEVGQFDN
jgi:hypothetical protein